MALEALLVPRVLHDERVYFLPGSWPDQVNQRRVQAVRDQCIVVKAAEESQHLGVVHAHDRLAER